MSRRWDIPLKS